MIAKRNSCWNPEPLPRPNAFTLIELLIVVAIIGILAVIAVPNFLNAQTRAKLARVQSDLRSTEMALEAYHIDNNRYPFPFTRPPNRLINVWELTTPIAYMTSINHLDDPFKPKRLFDPDFGNADTVSYLYHNFRGYWGQNQNGLPTGTCLKSDGPDHRYTQGCNIWKTYFTNGNVFTQQMRDTLYNGSNGLNSKGDIPWLTGEAARGRTHTGGLR